MQRAANLHLPAPRPMIIEPVPCDCPIVIECAEIDSTNYGKLITRLVADGRHISAKVQKLQADIKVYKVQQLIYEESIDNLTRELTGEVKYPGQ